MAARFLTVAFFLGGAIPLTGVLATPGRRAGLDRRGEYPNYSSSIATTPTSVYSHPTYPTTTKYTAVTPTSTAYYTTIHHPCHECDGYCGDGILDYDEECDDGPNNGKPWSRCHADCTWVDCSCGNGITEYPEECDDGSLNGTPYSHCTTDCKHKEDCGCGHPHVCGNGLIEYPEQCDDGWYNGDPNSNCTTQCTLRDTTHQPRCGDGHIDADETCDDGSSLNGTPKSNCDATCHWKQPLKDTCDPNPFYNKCTITTSCIPFLQSGKDYCACRAGYRASFSPTDPRQFRLPFPGQEYRVFVAPGVDCDTLCDHPFPGPDSCQEVPVRSG